MSEYSRTQQQVTQVHQVEEMVEQPSVQIEQKMVQKPPLLETKDNAYSQFYKSKSMKITSYTPD